MTNFTMKFDMQAQKSNKVIILSGPSGAGKTTLVRLLLEECPAIEFSVSACNRPPRAYEVHGKDYYFISQEKFKELMDQEEFLEYEEVYEGSYYGTLRSEIDRIWEKGKAVALDIDVAGGTRVKRKLGKDALAIFIAPPSIETLKERLKKRSTETDESFKKRIAKAEAEMEFRKIFDVIIINDTLKEAKEHLVEVVERFLEM